MTKTTEAEGRRIAVIASTLARANNLIRELGLPNAIAVSNRPNTVDGLSAHAIVVDETALPLSAEMQHALRVNLAKTPGGGQLYELRSVGSN